MGFRNRSRKENDGKYLRLTGLWPSRKKDNLWTGKFRNQDIEQLLVKVEEADKAGADLLFFLWENTEKSDKKDPDFTIQVTVADDQENGRSRGGASYHGRRARNKVREDESEEQKGEEEEKEKEEQNDEEEERPSRNRSSKASTKETTKNRSTSKPVSKRDKNDW